MPHTLRIATRSSPLALWQAEFVRAALCAAHPGLHVELLPMTTRGDRLLDVSLAKIGGKGLFIKELERAILARRADLAVHSMKDVPMELAPGLDIAAICTRAEPRDAFVSNRWAALDDLPEGARVGTSSARRRSQLLNRRPDLAIVELRGNVDTRLQRLDEGRCDALLLAAAGLLRLGRAGRIRASIDPEQMLPAVGQGAIGIECRSDDRETRALLAPLDDADSRLCVVAERAISRRLQGSCEAPIAGYAQWQGATPTTLRVRGLVGAMDGSEILRGEVSGPCSRGDDAERLGAQLADDLLARGAERVLRGAALPL